MKSKTKAKTPQRLSGKRLDQAVRKANAELAQERKISKQKAESRKQKANQPIQLLASAMAELDDLFTELSPRTEPWVGATVYHLGRIRGFLSQFTAGEVDTENARPSVPPRLRGSNRNSKIKNQKCFHPLSSDTLPEQIGGGQ